MESPKAYLSAVTTRLSIDHLRSARVRRESYVGTWLPEPVLTDTESDAARHAETADSLSLGFLVLLESLTPVERAVFLLREVFDYPYDEIATVVGRSEDNCRQIAVRARRQVQSAKPRFEASRKRREELARSFFGAVRDGDTDGLIGLLAADVVAYGDGGGRAPAFPRPVHGRERVARLLLGATARGERLGVSGMRHVEINGQPGALLLASDGRAVAAISLDIADSLIQAVRAISNPEKLHHLGSSARLRRRSGARPDPEEVGVSRTVDLSHVIEHGMTTYPGLPAPEIGDHLTREDSRARYAPGTEFHIGHIGMVGNTGTYLDTPFHRYADGSDLATTPLERMVELDGLVVDALGRPNVDADLLRRHRVGGRAVLIHTGWSRHWGSEAYLTGHPFLSAPGAEWLVEQGAALVGIDSLNVDGTATGERPAHSALLAAGIPIVEHLCHLDRLPAEGFRFCAAPPAVVGLGSFPVRAYAVLDA